MPKKVHPGIFEYQHIKDKVLREVREKKNILSVEEQRYEIHLISETMQEESGLKYFKVLKEKNYQLRIL